MSPKFRYVCLIWLMAHSTLSLFPRSEDQKNHTDLESRFQSAPEREKLELALQLIDLRRFPVTETSQLFRFAQIALELAVKLKKPMAEGKAWSMLGYSHYKIGDYQRALQSYLQARQIYAAIPDWLYVGHMNSEIGNLFFYCLSAGNQALVYYKKALKIYSKIGNFYNQTRTLNLMGEVHRMMGQYEKAAEFYIQALQKSETPDTPLMRRKRAVIYTNLSDIYFLLEDLPQSREYLKKAESIYLRENLRTETAQILTRRGDLAKRESSLDSALDYYYQALAIRRQWHQDHPGIAAELHKIADAHSLAGHTAEADRFFAEALSMRKSISDLSGTAQTLLAIGIHKRRQNLHREAHPFFFESLEIAQKNGLLREIQQAAREIADLKAWEKDGEGELKYRKIAEEAAERIQSPKISARVMKILLQYENNEQMRRLRANRRRIALILTFFLILAVSTLILLFGRHRKTKMALQSNRERVQEQQTQLERLKQRVKDLESPVVQARYRYSKLSWEQEQILLKKLIAVMEEEQLYLDPDLTLDSMAQKIGVNRTYLSQVINHSTGKTFSDFINSFRVEEAKVLIASLGERDSSFLDVCFESGFNTKAVFNRVFKKMTGMTPSEYWKSRSNQKS